MFKKAGPASLTMLGIAMAVALGASATSAQDSDHVEIGPAGSVANTRVQAARAQLARLIDTHDLARWTFTRTVMIEPRVVPHSHPVLTLNTRYVDDDDKALATYLHEQLHWYTSEHPDALALVKAELAALYPDLPTGFPDGARDADSNYLHLIVNSLEFRALGEVIGDERARAVFARHRHYRRLYDIVETDIEDIEAIMARHGFDLP